MGWLIALEAFLFSAYGFSLGAEATVSKQCGQAVVCDFSNTGTQCLLSNVRIGFALIGMLSPVVTMLGVLAAIRSMTDLVDDWHDKLEEHIENTVKKSGSDGESSIPEKAREHRKKYRQTVFKKYPQIIGNLQRRDSLGHYLGFAPVFWLPLLFMACWGWIGSQEASFSQAVCIVAAFILIISIPYVKAINMYKSRGR